MKKELKIYIDDPQAIEEKLKALGSKFIQEISVIDTYFKQPEGHVLKITQDDRGSLLARLQADQGGFRIIAQEPLDNPEKKKKELEAQFGIKCVLKKKRRFWNFQGYNINLNLFEDIGSFLIVEGENPQKSFIADTLGIKNPRYLTISFDKLKEQQMNESNIKAILFDLGGVLFTNGTKLLAKHIAEKHHVDYQKVYDYLNYSDKGNAYREGKITRDEFWDIFKKRLHISDNTDILEQKWIDVYEVVEETKEIVDELRKKYKVYFLSDNVKERVIAADKKYGFTQWFHGGIFSHEVGVRKPNMKIYEIALEKIGVKPEEALFIDDKQINLPPAEQLGMKTLIFTSPEELREDLKRIKLL